jgi:hypothetical protein
MSDVYDCPAYLIAYVQYQRISSGLVDNWSTVFGSEDYGG